MKSNDLEKKLVKFIEEQQKMNQEFKGWHHELKEILKEEKELKSDMIRWLKDHHVRLNLHWEEIRRR